MALAAGVKDVWEVSVAAEGKSAGIARSRHAPDIADKKTVNVAPVAAKVRVSGLPFLQTPTLKLSFGDASRGLLDHYVWWMPEDMSAPVAAVVITELPAKMRNHASAFKMVAALQTDYAEAAGARARFIEIESPYGKALEMLVGERKGSALFPTANYQIRQGQDGVSTVGISRFAMIGGHLVEWSIVVPIHDGLGSDEEVGEYAESVMDGFWLNVGVAY